MKAGLLGLLIFLLKPKALLFLLPLAVWQPALAWLCAGPVAVLLAVLGFAVRGKYPAWLVTTDDPVVQGTVAGGLPHHFGSYEATVRGIYTRFGRYVGDVYWLAWRNALYGLAYALKPEWLKLVTDYESLYMVMRRNAVLTRLWLFTSITGGPTLQEWRLHVGGLCDIVFGSALSQIYWHAPGVPVRPVNMDGRPTFTIRRGRWLGGDR